MKLAANIAKRLSQSGDMLPGAFNLAADILEHAELESRDWCNRDDDAIRIPDMLADAVDDLRSMAKGWPEKL